MPPIIGFIMPPIIGFMPPIIMGFIIIGFIIGMLWWFMGIAFIMMSAS
jgi:hypothetical protein